MIKDYFRNIQQLLWHRAQPTYAQKFLSLYRNHLTGDARAHLEADIIELKQLIEACTDHLLS